MLIALPSISLVVAQRLMKLEYAVKDKEELSTPGADKNRFLQPRGPGEDTRKVSAPGAQCQGLWRLPSDASRV